MFRTFVDMFKNKDIRNRIFFTLAMLFIFRFGSAITVPGVDAVSYTHLDVYKRQELPSGVDIEIKL